MSDDNTEEVEMTETDEEVEDSSETEQEAVEQDGADEDPNDGLKKALAAERKLRKAEKQRADLAEQKLSDQGKPADGQALEQVKRDARAEAMSAANERIRALTLRAALAGKVSNVDRALRLIDASVIDVDEDGSVDSDAVADAIEALLSDIPELAVKRFQGSADQGAKGRKAAPSQLSREDLKKLSPAQIVQAEKDGRLNKLKGIN